MLLHIIYHYYYFILLYFKAFTVPQARRILSSRSWRKSCWNSMRLKDVLTLDWERNQRSQQSETSWISCQKWMRIERELRKQKKRDEWSDIEFNYRGKLQGMPCVEIERLLVAQGAGRPHNTRSQSASAYAWRCFVCQMSGMFFRFKKKIMFTCAYIFNFLCFLSFLFGRMLLLSNEQTIVHGMQLSQ